MAKSEWQKHLMATYKKLKSKNKDAMLSDAMKIAGKTYKKKAVKGGALAPLTPKELGGEPVVDMETEEVKEEVEEQVMDGGKKKRKTAKRKTSKKGKKSKRKTGKKK